MMNKNTIRCLSVASLGALFAATPLACGSSDDGSSDEAAGTTSHGGTASNGGKAGNGGNSGNAGKSTGGNGGLSGETANGGQAVIDNGGAPNDGTTGGAGGSGGEATAPKARLRVVHASPNAPKVDIYPAGSNTAIATNIAYGQATDFIEVDAGTIAFDLRTAGAKASTAPAFSTDDIQLDGGADYTLVAAGDFAKLTDRAVGFRMLALEHDFAAPGAGNAIARVVHAESAWTSVDLDVASTTGVDLPGLDRFDSVSNVELPAGAAFDVAIQTSSAVLSKLTIPKLTAGNQLFVIATGNPGFPFRAPANGFALLVVDQDGVVSWVKEQPWVHVVNASDISTVDLYETGHTAAAAKLADNLAPAKLGEFQLPASVAGVTLKAVAADAPSGTATALASGATSTVEAGEHYLAYIAGSTVQTLHEQFDLQQPSKVMLRGVHASTALAQTVDFGLVDGTALGTVLIASVAPGTASAEAGVTTAPGNIVVGAATHGLTTLLAQTAFPVSAAPVAGERDFALLVGADGLWLIDTSVPGWTLR